MRRVVILTAALIVAGCSSHAVMPQQSITPQVGAQHVPPGWTVTKLKKIAGLPPDPTGLVAVGKKVWITASNQNQVGALYKVAMDKHVTEYSLNVTPSGSIALGPDQNLWITGAGGIITRYDIKAHSEVDFTVAAGMGVGSIVNGSDGKLWFGECSSDRSTGGVGTIAVDGTYSFYPSVCTGAIASGPDGNIWFGDKGANLYAMDTNGNVLGTYPVGDAAYFTGGVTGSDGALYFGSGSMLGADLVRVTTQGQVTHLGATVWNYPIEWMTNGADGQLWVSSSPTQGLWLVPFDTATQTWGTAIKAAGVGPVIEGPDTHFWLVQTGGYGGGLATH